MRRRVAHRQGLLVRGVEAEKPQLATARAVFHLHQQLAARAQLHLAGRHRGLDLHRLPSRALAKGVMRVSSS